MASLVISETLFRAEKSNCSRILSSLSVGFEAVEVSLSNWGIFTRNLRISLGQFSTYVGHAAYTLPSDL